MRQRADQRKFHYIYKIIRDDGRYYIGMHSTDNLDDGYFGSGKRITRSIKKYGKERHKKEILEFCPSRSELKNRELEIVNEELLKDPQVFNLTIGGNGGNNINWTVAGRKEKHSQIMKKASTSLEVRAKKSSAAKKLWDNPKHREKVKAKLKEVMNTAEMSLRLSSCSKNKTEETRSAISAGLKKAYEETNLRARRSETCKNKRWVTLGEVSKQIDAEQLEEFLNSGYVRGRKRA